MSLKKLYIDCETTGLDPKCHALIQIAGWVEIDGQAQPPFNYRMRPHEGYEIDYKALAVNGYSVGQMMELPHMGHAFQQLLHYLGKYVNPQDEEDKYLFVAHNAMFDYEFMKEFFLRNHDEGFSSWFWNPPLCTMQMALNHLQARRASMPDFKLATIARTLGIPLNESSLHDALYDVGLMKKVEGVVVG